MLPLSACPSQASPRSFDLLFQQNEELSAQNEELREQIEHLRKRCENLVSRTEGQRTIYEQLREDRDAECRANKELLEENSELRKYWNAERVELHVVNKRLRAQNDELMTKTKELFTENEELCAMVDQFKNQFKEMLHHPDSAVRGDDTSSIKVSAGVNSTEIIP